MRGQRFIGSAQVTSNSANQPLVVIVNQLLPNRNGESYSGFDPSLATNKVVMPLIMDRNSGYFTGFNVMNVGTTSTTVTCTFTGTSYTVTGTLNQGQALTDLQSGKIANGYVGSGTCTASGSGKIVAVVNELGPSSTSDQSPGLTRVLTTNKVVENNPIVYNLPKSFSWVEFFHIPLSHFSK